MRDLNAPGANRQVALTAAPHPFKVASDLRYVPEGLTLAEMLELVQPDPILARHAVAFIAGDIIPRENWARVRPKAGTHVEIRVLPSGGDGGKNILRIVLTIAVIAAAIYFPPLAGLGPLATAALGAAISVGGMLAINAIVPVRPPENRSEKSDPSFSIFGSRNRSLAFEPVPQVLGRHRMAPPYGAAPFTEIVGKDQYVRMIFVWGIGPLVIDTSTLKIGETPITDFEDVQIQHRQGLPGDTALTLYSDTVVQTDPAQELTDTTFSQRTTATGADEISVDVTWPFGLTNIRLSDGKAGNITVTLQINFRKVGDSTWLTPTFTATTVPADWINEDLITVTHKSRDPVRHGFRWDTAERAQYEVRVRRTTAPSGNVDHIERTFWQTLRTFTDEDPINSTVPVAKTALRIRATDQLNRVIDEFNGIVTTKGLDWNGSSWVADQEITNPASLFRHVLQGKAIASPLADSRLDLTKLQTWHDANVTRGFTFNQTKFSQSSVWETLADVAGAGRAAPTQVDGKWSVVIEEPKAVAVSHITPRNSFGFSAEKAFLDQPHAWRVRFPNEDEGYRPDERRVYRDGFTQANATKFETLELPGVTDPAQIQKLGRFRIAQFMLQPERWTFSQDMDYLTYQRGDRVLITHDVLLVGQKAGRIKSVTVDGSNNVTALVFDEEITMLGGTDYGVSIRTVADAAVTAQVVTVAETTTSVTLTSSIPNDGGNPAVAKGDLFGFGILGQETDDASIIAIVPNNDFVALITAVPYRVAIFDADSESIPVFDTNLTPLPVIPAPVITSVVSDETAIILGPGQSLQTRVLIAFDPLDDPRLDNPHIRVQIRPSETGEPFRAVQLQTESSQHIALGGVIDGETIDIRLRFEVEGRLPGPWITIFNHTVVGKSTPPGDLTGLTLSAFGGQALLRWDQPSEIDVLFGGEVRFRHSSSLSGATWQASSSIGQAAQARDLIATLPLKSGTYLARVFDSVGNPSDGIASVTTKQASITAFASVSSLDEATAWSGTHTGTVKDGVTLKLTNAALWDSFADFDAVPDIDGSGFVVLTGTYDFAAGFDLTTVKNVRLTTRVTMSSDSIFDNIDDWSDFVDDREDWDGGVQGVGDVKVEVRHTDDDPGGSPTWTSWERLDSAEFNARGFDFRAILTTTDPAFNVIVTVLGIDVEEIA